MPWSRTLNSSHTRSLVLALAGAFKAAVAATGNAAGLFVSVSAVDAVVVLHVMIIPCVRPAGVSENFRAFDTRFVIT